jgi:3-methylcrotonyl-CoA carboxylase alpha subunit
VVESGDAFEAALASVKREASASFGDDKVGDSPLDSSPP